MEMSEQIGLPLHQDETSRMFSSHRSQNARQLKPAFSKPSTSPPIPQPREMKVGSSPQCTRRWRFEFLAASGCRSRLRVSAAVVLGEFWLFCEIGSAVENGIALDC